MKSFGAYFADVLVAVLVTSLFFVLAAHSPILAALYLGACIPTILVYTN